MPLACSFVVVGGFAGTSKNNSKPEENMKIQALRNHLLAGLAGITLLGLTSARADQQVSAMFDMGARVNARITASD